MGKSQRHTCICGCVVDQSWDGLVMTDAVLTVSCGRHGTWVEAEAESCAASAAMTRLDAEGVAAEHWRWVDGALHIQARDVPAGLADRLNATEPEQDWRVDWVPEAHRAAFEVLMRGHLLACQLEAL